MKDSRESIATTDFVFLTMDNMSVFRGAVTGKVFRTDMHDVSLHGSDQELPALIPGKTRVTLTVEIEI